MWRWGEPALTTFLSIMRGEMKWDYFFPSQEAVKFWRYQTWNVTFCEGHTWLASSWFSDHFIFHFWRTLGSTFHSEGKSSWILEKYNKKVMEVKGQILNTQCVGSKLFHGVAPHLECTWQHSVLGLTALISPPDHANGFSVAAAGSIVPCWRCCSTFTRLAPNTRRHSAA